MDFFAQQDQARRNTSALVLLFILAVIALIIITNVLVMVVFWGAAGQVNPGYQLGEYFSWRTFGLISLVVTGVVACAIAYKWIQLSAGGKRVAESLGGHRIAPNTRDADENRVLNVVEEMAIASGMPVPPVYLLSEEAGINAFAAGNTPADAVIGVTRGCIEQFDREQLQGVIAHEFSHILNGDMRLNIRLIALLNGILFIGGVGEVLLRGGSRRHRSVSSSRRSGDNRLALLGLGLLIIGWLGGFFGKLIKSMVSRQREFLADASAVQFTRNPQGIADALKIIGGYSLRAAVTNPASHEISHLFFGQAIGTLGRMFATHPPLEDRISRIEPHWDGRFIHRAAAVASEGDEASGAAKGTKAAVMAAILAGQLPAALAGGDLSPGSDAESELSKARKSINNIPAALLQHAHDPFGASALVYALLLDQDERVQLKQLGYIEQGKVAGLALQTSELAPVIAKMNRRFRLPLLELSLPALKCLSLSQYKVFRKTLGLLMRADRKLELFEWCLYQLVSHYLDPEHMPVKPVRPLYKKSSQVAAEYQLVLSTLAHYGHQDEPDRAKAFGRGTNIATLYNISLLPKQECKLEDFIKAVNKLANCYPLIKHLLLRGLVQCARQDGRITTEEQEIIASVAAVMDCPMPQLEKL